MRQLAQLNIGKLLAGRDDPAMAGFFDNLDRINAAAEQFARRRPEVIQVRGIGSLPPA